MGQTNSAYVGGAPRLPQIPHPIKRAAAPSLLKCKSFPQESKRNTAARGRREKRGALAFKGRSLSRVSEDANEKDELDVSEDDFLKSLPRP